MCDEEPQADIETRSWAKKLRARQIQKLIRDIRILERKRLASIDFLHFYTTIATFLRLEALRNN